MTSPTPTDLAPYFRARHFEPQHEPAQMAAVQRLRFDVYCLECRYLEAADYPDGLESDERDGSCAHFCSHHVNGELAGYVRLAFADASGRFPFQEHGASVHPGFELPPAEASAEISRLMVSRTFRRRRGDIVTGVQIDEPGAAPAERRLASPQILLSMYRQMYQYSNAHGIRYWYAAMERHLVKSLGRFDFEFTQIGPEMEYYGAVAPYMTDLRRLEDRGRANHPALWDWLAAAQ